MLWQWRRIRSKRQRLVLHLKCSEFTKILVGTWKVELDYACGGSMPNGGKGPAHSVIRPGPGGFSLIEGFEGDLPPGSLHALYWCDKAAQAFKSMGCNDSAKKSGKLQPLMANLYISSPTNRNALPQLSIFAINCTRLKSEYSTFRRRIYT